MPCLTAPETPEKKKARHASERETERVQTLRTTFRFEGNGPVQVVSERAEIEHLDVDLRSMDAREREERARTIASLMSAIHGIRAGCNCLYGLCLA